MTTARCRDCGCDWVDVATEDASDPRGYVCAVCAALAVLRLTLGDEEKADLYGLALACTHREERGRRIAYWIRQRRIGR